jgi:type VI secretion system secreted protein VgrG
MSENWIVELDPVAGVELVLREMSGTEALGRPFKYDLEVLADAEHLNLDLDDLLGQSMTVRVELPDDKLRYFNGLIDEASCSGMYGQKGSFQLTLRPWFWFLSKKSHCRIFQNENVVGIVKKVFEDNGFSDFDVGGLSKYYEKREYCVQYRESDFDFVSRLLEDEGIYYYWSHDGKTGTVKHTMVLADSYSAHEPAEGYDEIVYRTSGEAQEDQDHISKWTLRHQVCTSAFAMDSYNYETPSTDLTARDEVVRQHAHHEHERFDYGALYGTRSLGEAYTKTRIQELNAQQAVGEARADARGVSCGALFTLGDHPREDQNKEYLIVAAVYSITNSDVETGGGSATADFDVKFTAIDSQAAFRPARVTPRSVVRGPQTAVVVGKSGEDIWTDKYGRVKVQFHWDNEGKKDENSSCWVRVAHAWAGKNWGTVAIPRIGQEVIVDFLEGDPDQPLITGSVYNKENMPPYALPDNQTQTGIKTRSTKSGDKNKYNELRFEDKTGDEEIYFHAQRDFKRVVENNDTLEIGLETKDDGDQTITIHNDRSVTLKEGNDKLDVKKTIDIKAGDELAITVGQSKLTMKSDGTIELKGSKITIEGQQSLDATGLMTKVEGKTKLDLKSVVVNLDASAMANIKGGIVKIN